ncbi:MAG: sortase [Clostridiales bacterium]|nr:sortase [Clostridiales bacterium]
MRRAAFGKPRAGLLGFLAKTIIIVGIAALIAPYAMRYWNYQTSVVLALEKEDQLGERTSPYERIDYSKLSIAAPCVYTAEEIEAAQRSPGIWDDFTGLDEGDDPAESAAPASATAETSENKDESYLLEIPEISLKICVNRCKSFDSIYRCMRSGAAIFPNAPEPDEIGNICMSAHRTGSRDFFRNLDQLAKGDTVYLHYQKNLSYQYQVVSVSIIESDDWSVTGQTLYPALTLLSCQEYQGVSNGRRIMVRAKLVGVSR